MFLSSLFAESHIFKYKGCDPDEHGTHKAISSSQLGCYSKLVEYELIREVILDMAYEYELNLLTCHESDIYCTVARIWTECHVSKEIEETCFYSKEDCGNKIISDILSILHTRMEKKLDERLVLFGDDNQDQSQSNHSVGVEKLQKRKNELSTELRRLQASFTEIVSRICSTSSRLFREYRHLVWPRMSRQALAVLTEQAKALLLRVKSLQKSIEYSASQPSETLNILKEIHIELANSRCVLQTEVKELEALLATYENKDGEYHKLVKRYVDCQQQLSLRSTLLHDTDNVQLNRRSHKNFSCRRSLSADVMNRK
ncbi:unnamed protein product [Schistosoma rodhaini]|uniref:Coiled-coil domain-containing protein 142 n=2 Tax=Schistosoma rodhaini TaxID=6188 RepID=A0A183R602_9TREM|nr:unnamed protein product [Schistosoma rodhaini]